MLIDADKEKLQQLLQEWQGICENKGDDGLIFSNDIEEKIKGLETQIKEDDCFAYILEEDKNSLALLDVIKTRYDWLKIYDMTITPKAMLEGSTRKDIENALSKVFAEAIEMLVKSKDKNLKEIKIYARTDITKELFTRICQDSSLRTTLKNMNVSIAFVPNWLYIRK